MPRRDARQVRALSRPKRRLPSEPKAPCPNCGSMQRFEPFAVGDKRWIKCTTCRREWEL